MRIFVTGTGIISGLGQGKTATLEALRAHRSSVGKVKYLQTTHTEIPVSEVPMSNEEMCHQLNVSENEKHVRTVLLGEIALQEALQEANLNPAQQRTALISGTTVGGMDKSEIFYKDFFTSNENIDFLRLHDCGACSRQIAQYFGGFDLVTTPSTACSSAANAILLGKKLIEENRVDVAVVGGSECITKFHLNGFHSLMILDSERCKPFSNNRAGLNLGEGAGYLVLESEESVKKRNAKPLCELTACANRCDAFHQTASSPNGEGAFLSMTDALNMANLKPTDIDYINAHGTGTGSNDLSEGIAIQRVFGESIPPVASIKAYLGHTTSAAGGIESVISVMTITHQYRPIHLGFTGKIEELNFSPYAEEKPLERPIKNVLSNAFGFGGNDTVCIFSAL